MRRRGRDRENDVVSAAHLTHMSACIFVVRNILWVHACTGKSWKGGAAHGD